MSNYLKISKCRVCGGELRDLWNFGNLAISDFTDVPSEGDRMPLELVGCRKCTLVQLSHNPPKELLYREFYWYESGINEVIVDDLKDIVDTTMQYKSSGIWIDIGANDGTLFEFVPKTFTRIGIEPAKNLITKLAKQADHIENCFWEDWKGKSTKASVITAIGMFYDAIDPNEFISKVAKHLDDKGVFVAQLMTLVPQLKTNDLGNICHEHIEFYTYQSLVELYERNGLEIIRVDENGINGGSYRIFARHIKDGSIDYEEDVDLVNYFKNIEKNKRDFIGWLKMMEYEGKSVYGYGASTKGNTYLQYYGIDASLIKGIADKDPKKHGLYTVNTNIPIVSEKEAREKADAFVVLPWGFIDYFIRKEREQGFKGQMVVNTPKFKIYE